MKKIIVLLVFILFAFGVYYIKINNQDNNQFYYHDDFDELDSTFWYAGKWKTLVAAYDQIRLNNGIVKLTIDSVDAGPVLLSEPITVEEDQVLTVKRRVRLTPGEQPFFGGFALMETSDEGLLPSVLNQQGQTMGNGLVLIEYTKGNVEDSKRPGKDVFRVLPRTWAVEAENDWIPSIFKKWVTGNYQLVSPIYNQWFEEELTFDNSNGKIIYKINDKSYVVWSEKLKTEKIRLYIHGYGFGVGHSIEMDWIEISVH
ncbi:MAG: hypothetical protein JXR88_17550 [Clostridia bacterium]|nr:hypothetical protein [Clostridia bacterium]